MNLSTFVPYVPFLALIYALFALLQALRHRQQGIAATLLALIAVAAPVIAYILSSAADVHASLLQSILINAAVVFIASLLTLLVERRNPQRDPRHSFGMFGVGVSMILVVAMFALPLLTSGTSRAAPPAFANTVSTNSATTTSNNTDSGQIVLASDRSAQNPFSQTTNTTAQAQAETTENAPQAQATTIPTATAIPTQAATVVRPTPIVFPTNTPTPEVSATTEVTAEASAATAATAATVSNAATCTLTVDYNLNLRNQPTTDGSTVLLSIPYGTTVTTDGKTADGWYRVSYNDQTGWVSGQYVTASASCASLATVSAS